MQITENIISIIKDNQSQSIKLQTLTDQQLALAYENQWFNIWVPKKYSGKNLNLSEGIQFLQDLAYLDGGLSWTITLCSGAKMFAGFIHRDTAQEVFSNSKVCLGGSGRAGGKAIWNGEYYEITGVWQYATGSPHLTHFTLNAYVYDNDKQRFDNEGNAIIYSFFVPREDVLIHYDWQTFGLECTASHSFSLENVKVTKEHAFVLDIDNRVVDTALFRIPFKVFGELTLLPNYLGMYGRFLNLVEKYYFDKSKDTIWANKYSKTRFKQLDVFQAQHAKNQDKLKSWANKIWQLAELGLIKEDLEIIKEIEIESRQIVKSIRESVTTLFPLLGISASQRDSEINIVFRNLFTATQHSLLNLPLEEIKKEVK